MADARDRLSAALAERYRIERALGEGGMATVYLAEDLKHHPTACRSSTRAPPTASCST